ncbi:RDD family protein [Mycobacterium sp. THU-M104]|uniref:RDD family protein n=1 Tax=Mycobacterium sp. THU-M104 TaxID=3410515 RepID=UPI003B99573D
MTPGARSAYPGQAIGLPRSGAGSLAPMGRRLAALLIDWLISYGLAELARTFGLLSQRGLATAVLVIWFVLGVVAVRLFGSTPGQLTLGLGVAAVDGRQPVGVIRLAVRGLLVGLVIPALFTDFDGRGLHDRVTGTAVVRR